MIDWKNIVAIGLTIVFGLFVIKAFQSINSRKSKKKKGYTWQPELGHDVHEAEIRTTIGNDQHRIWLTPKTKPGHGPKRRR